MRRILAVGWVTVFVTVLAAQLGVAGEEEKLILGFEKEEFEKWGKVEETADGLKFTPKHADTTFIRCGGPPPYQVVKGDCTQGKFALASSRAKPFRVRPRSQYVPDFFVYRYPRLQHWYYPRGVLLTGYKWFCRHCRTDWSGYDLLRLDVKSTKTAARVLMQIEDADTELPVIRTFGVPAGKWVTLEIDLDKVVKARQFDLKNMATFIIGAANVPAGTTILIDNMRLARRGVKTKLPTVTDLKALKLPAMKIRRQLPPVVSVKPDRSPVTLRKPIVLRPPGDGLITLAPLGWIAAFDNKHLLLTYTALKRDKGESGGSVNVLHTTDGGTTWKGLDGKDTPTRLKVSGNLDHGTGRGGQVDLRGDALLFNSLGCAGADVAVPRIFAFKLTFTGTGWQLRNPTLVDCDIRQCMSNYTAVRLKNGRLWAAWGHRDRRSMSGIHARFSDDDGRTWHTWNPGKSARIPASFKKFTPQAGVSKYSYRQARITPYGEHVACFWQDGKGLWWSRFDGKEWTEAELVDGRGTVPLAEQGFRGQGSVVAVGKNELFVTATNVAGVLRWDGKTWHKENIPGAVDAGCLTVCGDTVMLVTAGRDEPGWHGIQWTRTAKVLCYRRDPRTGKWDKPLQLSKGEVELYIYRAIPALSVPRYSPPNFAPVAWTGSDRKTIYIVKVPARRRSPPWRTLRITYLHTRSVMAARELKGGR